MPTTPADQRGSVRLSAVKIRWTRFRITGLKKAGTDHLLKIQGVAYHFHRRLRWTFTKPKFYESCFARERMGKICWPGFKLCSPPVNMIPTSKFKVNTELKNIALQTASRKSEQTEEPTAIGICFDSQNACVEAEQLTQSPKNIDIITFKGTVPD